VRPVVQGASNEEAVSRTREKSTQRDVYLTRGLATRSINSFEPLQVPASVKFYKTFPHCEHSNSLSTSSVEIYSYPKI
jgi:hypothetical protein